jgi:phage tail-like protein
MPLTQAYAAGRFQLELDDASGQAVAVGFVNSIDGGHFKADPIKSMVGDSRIVTYYAGKPKFEDITISMGMAASPPMWDWIKASLHRKPERRNGAIVGYDLKNRERSRRSFYNALISEVGFPAMDSGAKSTAMLQIKISPETVHWDNGDESELAPAWAQHELRKQKLFLTKNFQFLVDKFQGDKALRHAKIDAFTVKQNIAQAPVGTVLHNHKEPARIDLPALNVTFATSHVDPWHQWWHSTVHAHAPETTNAALVYYGSDNYQTELMRLEFKEMTLLNLEFEKFEAQKDGISRVKAVLQPEDVHYMTGEGTV